MEWKWLVVILIPSLLSGCLASKGVARLIADQIDPFDARPPCPDAGTRAELPPSKPCYYKFEITNSDKLDSHGVVDGRIPYATVEEMKIYREGDSEGQKALREQFDPGSYPRDTHKDLAVMNPKDLKADLEKHNNKLVAYFVLNVGDDNLTYIPEVNVCTEKEKLILQHAKQYETEKFDIPKRYTDECTNLLTIGDRTKVAN